MKYLIMDYVIDASNKKFIKPYASQFIIDEKRKKQIKK